MKKKPQYACPTCKNLRTASCCDYCNWKGTEGMGAKLKQMVKEANHETEKQAVVHQVPG